MKISKELQKLLEKRERLAMDLNDAVVEVDNWLERHGADFTDPDLVDSTLTGCMIYCEPESARRNVEDYIRYKL